jgi:OOP family OmpA-OmpF porin
MNYSTLKKTLALSFVSLMAVGAANAQMADTTKSAMMTTPKLFGGSSQYNTWSVGVNLGLPSLMLATGGSNGFNHWTPTLGYGVEVRDQIVHSFGLAFDYNGGQVKGGLSDRQLASATPWVTNINGEHYASFSTTYNQFSLSSVLNVATVDYLRRKNAISFYLNAGLGIIYYTPTVYGANTPGFPTTNSSFKSSQLVVPVGGGVKFRVTDAIAINLGYTENFIDASSFNGANQYPVKSHYSYGYGGVEYTFGPKTKPNLEWVNPIALMYDELYDEALRQEVAALKGRVGKVEDAVRDLKKDSDGDGVSDQFDKCPNTPAGTVVDGSGCPIIFPKVDTSLFMRKPMGGAAVAFSNIQFEFDSSVLRTSSYPVLDATSADLRASGSTCELAGYASSEGTAAHNMRLSKDRANSVKTYLVNSGVEAKKLKVKAFGETHPIADNSTEEGRVLNRRVEFKK